jgi:SAM-dependent methyltransferase
VNESAQIAAAPDLTAHSQPPGVVATSDVRCPVCGARAWRQREVVRAGRVGVCSGCGSWFRIPRPRFEDLVKIYDARYYDSWGLKQDQSIARRTKEATFEPLLCALEAALLPLGGAAPRILDVGAATGLLLELAEVRGWETYAVELNPYSAQVLRERFGLARVYEGELTSCDFPPSSFDYLTMTDLIEHVLDIPGTLQAAARLLRPGGLLALTTPQIDSWSRRLMGRVWLHFKEEHVQYFSRAGLGGALEQVGFREIRVQPARKRLTLDYLYVQLRTYPHWLLTPLAAATHTVLPSSCRARPLSHRCGEMLVLARRGGSSPQQVHSKSPVAPEHRA